MNDTDRIKTIKERLATNAYFINPHSDANVQQDITFLLQQIDDLQKKNRSLSDHATELAQEIENVKSDFGGDPR